ncbi:DNA repair protein [Helicobacter mustelae]|uniref:DNA recombination protein RecN n=1 Tax=Helicobacter mustelae TaxID=217 RepID=UPI000E07441A|nr:DNA recombination protein RecN [Helicobacter mustelae]STP13057.1 DNA repair protein [Helicobacter mustelae]
MIEYIKIKENIVFENVELELFAGLNVFSGASGSGKSVFMESLLGVFGLRESNAKSIQTLISGIPWESEEELVLHIQKNPKTRYNLNGNIIAKKTLQNILAPAIKHISLKNAAELRAQNLLKTLDCLIIHHQKGYKELLDCLKKSFCAYKNCQSEYQDLLKKEQNLQELRELASFEIQKISSINPKIGEYEKLMELKKSLSKKEKLQDKIAYALQAFDHLDCIHDALQACEIELPHFSDSLLEAKEILQEQNNKLQDLEGIEPEELLERISNLASLNQRYGSIEGALAHLKTQKEKLKDYENLSFHKEELEKQCQELEKQCQQTAKEITKWRGQFLELFKKELEKNCQTLKLQHLAVSLIPCAITENGTEELEIKLKESPVQNLSMGEYNRLRLALICLDCAYNQNTGILVLDEIDANLSGEESEGVAKILKILSQSYQVFAISHQPHLPALANHHYLVYKTPKGSQIKELNLKERIQEVARMISGTNITKEALDFAKKHLGG